MEDSEKMSLEQIQVFLEASEEVRFQAKDRVELYGWVERTLREQNYPQLSRPARGLVRHYLAKMTGLSRAQTTRLIGFYQQGQEVKPRAYRRRRFPQRYTAADIELLAEVDTAHETLSGPAKEQFPFRIRGFHSDNGSEFINHTVSRLLNKLLVEQTKSRPRHSNDNGLAETKNGWVIRKHIGYGHITAQHAEEFDQFYREHFNPYLNFHRPCGVPEMKVTAKGKQKRLYSWYATPWDILRQLPGLAGHLRPDVTAEQLAALARRCSDTQAAQQMQEAKRKLFAGLSRKRSA